MWFFSGVHQQDSAWSWMVLLTATLNDTLAIFMAYCYALILPVLVEEFNETRENAAWVSSISFSLGFLASPLSAQLCSHLGNRCTAIIGSITCAVGLISSSYSPSLELMYFTHSVLFGLGSSFIHVSGILILQRYFQKRRSLATGIFATHSSIASLMGPLFQSLLDSLGWRKAFLVVGSSFVVPLLLSLIFYSPNVNDKKECDNRPSSSSGSRLTCSYWNSWYTLGVIAIAMQCFAIYPPIFHMVKHANEVAYPKHKSSLLLLYIGIMSLIGKVAAGRLLDLPQVCVFWMNQVACVVTSFSLVLLTFAKNDVGFVSFAMIYGLGNGLFVSSMFSLWLNSVSRDQRPMGLATGEVMAAIGMLTGSPFIGFLADHKGSYKMAFISCAIILFASSLFLFLRFFFKRKVFEIEQNRENDADIGIDKEYFLERETVL